MKNSRQYRPLFTSEYELFIEKLKLARKEKGLTQEQVDDQLGIYKSFLRRCEGMQRRVDFIELLKLAKIYDKPIEYFIVDVKKELEID